MGEINVRLGQRSYPIIVANGILERCGELIPNISGYSRIVILTHPGLSDLYAGPIMRGLQSSGIECKRILAPPGEHRKNLRTVASVYDGLTDSGADRRSLLITVGGGVLGDLGGFAAATYMRGIDYVQVPTTLLAQVDASIGGKTGVDTPAGKNLIGAFHQPRAVLIDPETLRTLPLRELRSGLAEVVKYGIIADEALFDLVANRMPLLLRRDPSTLASVIEKSCRIKAEVVADDETEQGRRAILNFGHTIGHAFESLTEYRTFKHGEAISIGMLSASLIGEELGTTPPEFTSKIDSVLRSARLPTQLPSEVTVTDLLQAITRDKKSIQGRPRFVLARSVGNVEYGIDVPETTVREALERHASREKQ